MGSPVRRGIITPLIPFFFARPKLEVKIIKRELTAPDLLALDSQREDGKIPEVATQSIMVCARKGSINELGAKVLVSGTEYRLHLSWLYPRKSEFMVRDEPRYIRLIKDDEVPLQIWRAERIKGEDTVIVLNVVPTIVFTLSSAKKAKITHMDFDLQFIPVDKKPRPFRFTFKSWEDINLSQRE